MKKGIIFVLVALSVLAVISTAQGVEGLIAVGVSVDIPMNTVVQFWNTHLSTDALVVPVLYFGSHTYMPTRFSVSARTMYEFDLGAAMVEADANVTIRGYKGVAVFYPATV